MNTPTLHPTPCRLIPTFTTVFGLAMLSASAAFADDTDKFTEADADVSGALSFAEFKTTVSGKTDEAKVLKKFKRADSNGDQSVTLEEWLAYKQEIEDELDDLAKYTAIFNEADKDDDGFLTYDEFKPLVKGKAPLIESRKRFLKADADDDLQVSLNEWLAFKNDAVEDVKFRKFDLADADNDDQLTLLEFTTVFPQKTKAGVISKKFEKEDKDDDGFLTRDEWNPGGKKSSDPA